jgi:hypothetical protein
MAGPAFLFSSELGQSVRGYGERCRVLRLSEHAWRSGAFPGRMLFARTIPRAA